MGLKTPDHATVTASPVNIKKFGSSMLSPLQRCLANQQLTALPPEAPTMSSLEENFFLAQLQLNIT